MGVLLEGQHVPSLSARAKTFKFSLYSIVPSSYETCTHVNRGLEKSLRRLEVNPGPARIKTELDHYIDTAQWRAIA